jgi:coenzyme F420-reducing hydrogenase alpha subunit
MATSPILAFIDSRTNQAQRKAMSAIKIKKEKSPTQHGGPPGRTRRSAAYVYAIIVDGVVRYIGKGRHGRMYTHLIEAKRTSARCSRNTAHLSPRMHRKLVEAVRAGSQIIETVIKSGLTDRATYQLERRMIGEFHKFRAGQLWNTIDERFLDPRYLPEEWDDPEHPLYRLPRPVGNPQLTGDRARSKRTNNGHRSRNRKPATRAIARAGAVLEASD